MSKVLKSFKKMVSSMAMVVLLCSLLLSTAYGFDYGSIDPSRMPVQDWKNTVWSDPGNWTTIDVTTQGLPANNSSIDAAAQIATIIANTSGNRRLYFPNGTYYFKTSLNIGTNNIWIQGENRNTTIFKIDAPGSANAQIKFSGSVSATSIAVTGAISAGTNTITVADASSLSVGNNFQLYADNAPLTQGGKAFTSEVYSQILTVTAKTGNTITTDMKVLLDYPASYTPMVRKINNKYGIKVERIKIERVNEPTADDVSNLAFYYMTNCYVRNIDSSFAGRNHIYFQASKNCVIEDNYLHDCWQHEAGYGYGYGINLASTTGCRVTNNSLTRLRHQIILQVGANHNVISYNSIDGQWDYNDMALHAGFAYMNLFEGNVFKEGYADTSKDGWSDCEDSTGPGNTWFRNRATGKVGSIQSGTTRQNVIGNFVRSLSTSGSNHYMGANYIDNSTWNWGTLSSSSTIPASLYLTSKPSFLGSTPWPVYGPATAYANSIPASEFPNNKVANSGFETGSLSSWNGGSSNWTVTNADKFSGTYSLKLTGTGGWSNVTQNVAVTPNTMYTWDVWVKSSSSGLRFNVLTTSNAVIQDCGYSLAENEWRKYSFNFNSGNNSTIKLYLGDGGSGTHIIDDISVR